MTLIGSSGCSVSRFFAKNTGINRKPCLAKSPELISYFLRYAGLSGGMCLRFGRVTIRG